MISVGQNFRDSNQTFDKVATVVVKLSQIEVIIVVSGRHK